MVSNKSFNRLDFVSSEQLTEYIKVELIHNRQESKRKVYSKKQACK